ncbi:hypothetical protein SAMN06265337_4259 [Hymenobacter gelipurpurascens]|uniref:Uncharacterized protein n=1 Tax=Hymenobacter gelipurpurascens TaxID=89968 RepID=A0A212UHC3_9BACT|nr:hypothetical protein [Hymenobacter gelipurpurascens]SNC77659.1 hypothetical protein SAMN06265337_4259 [Hymenobacter gelipurpurascens]
MLFLLHLWLSQYPYLADTERGSTQIASAALLMTEDVYRYLPDYERSLLTRVARREITVGHLLAYLRQKDQD